MAETFFERPILNSPYEIPTRHHDLDEEGHLDEGLLAKAFRGELVQQDPNGEPAEKLPVHRRVQKIQPWLPGRDAAARKGFHCLAPAMTGESGECVCALARIRAARKAGTPKRRGRRKAG